MVEAFIEINKLEGYNKALCDLIDKVEEYSNKMTNTTTANGTIRWLLNTIHDMSNDAVERAKGVVEKEGLL